MSSIRLQHLQWGGALAAALCCLALGAMTFIASLEDYRRVRRGAEAFGRFEAVSDAINAIVAERAAANVLIAAGTPDEDKVLRLRRVREDSDRLLTSVEVSLVLPDPTMEDLRFVVDDLQARLEIGRRLIDAFIATPPDQRRSQDFRTAIEEMFATATAGDVLRDRFGQVVIAAAPEVSVEVFLSFAVGALRDQAGRLGSYVVMAQREGGRDPASIAKLQATAGRVHAGNRILNTLAHALPRDNAVMDRLAEVERNYFESALPYAIATAGAAGTERGIDTSVFAPAYGRGLTVIDGLRGAIAASSNERLERIGTAAFRRAAIAGSLTLLTCLILFLTIVVFRRALFAPLVRAREEAIAISRGDLSAPVAGRRVAGEVGEMLAGLDAIRGEQRWRRELEEQQAEMARQLKRLSETDMLTGLLNRRAVEEVALGMLAEADRANEPIAVLLFDVDHFKSINDTFGHAVGDDVLRAIAREVTRLLRPGDAFARFGGEEFLILLPGAGAEQAAATARALCLRLPSLVKIAADERRVTASFGLAVREPGSRTGWEGLVAMADRRLYAAKRSGRDRVCDDDVPVEVVAA